MSSLMGSSTRVLNEIPQAVDDALLGLAMSNKGLVVLEGSRVLMRRDHYTMHNRVKLISGGGGGHEPAHGGFVGPGMLTASICGDIFTSPPSNTILRCIRELSVDHEEGILLIVKNYTGDRLNFGLAMERARNENINVKMIVVGEDCSVPNPSSNQGRRGLAGVVLIHKIAGAMAEEGQKIDDIFNACKSATNTDMATIGFGLRVMNHPGAPPSVKAGKSELELGLGIHNEPGVHKLPMGTAAEIARSMLDHMWNPHSKSAIVLTPKCKIAVLVNNLGGSSKLEEQIFAMETLKQFKAKGYVVERSYCGTFLTSLDMPGFSITVLKLTNPDVLRYLDAPTAASGWPRVMCAGCVGMDNSADLPVRQRSRCDANDDDDKPGSKHGNTQTQAILTVLTFVAQTLVSFEKQLNKEDDEAGDGDCGTTMKRGAQGIISAIKHKKVTPLQPYAILEHISTVAEQTMGGTSGALYSIFFAAAAKPLKTVEATERVEAETWLAALSIGVEAVKRYGLAKEGDRTMLDALIAAENAVSAALKRDPRDGIRAMGEAAEAAEAATDRTVKMTAKMGRASYTPQVNMKMPDPGAHCVAIWMRALVDGIKLVNR